MGAISRYGKALVSFPPGRDPHGAGSIDESILVILVLIHLTGLPSMEQHNPAGAHRAWITPKPKVGHQAGRSKQGREGMRIKGRKGKRGGGGD